MILWIQGGITFQHVLLVLEGLQVGSSASRWGRDARRT
jgi:hypothetical protein